MCACGEVVTDPTGTAAGKVKAECARLRLTGTKGCEEMKLYARLSCILVNSFENSGTDSTVLAGAGFRCVEVTTICCLLEEVISFKASTQLLRSS